jgi:hypothetical protein
MKGGITMDLKQDVRVWTIFTWLRIEISSRYCKHSNEALGSIKGKEFDHPSNYQLLKKDSALWN